MIKVKGIWMHQDVIDKKLIVGEHKIKDISMGARITSITSHMKILLQKKEIIQNIRELDCQANERIEPDIRLFSI